MTLLAFIAPATARNVLLVLVGGCYLGYHLFHLWRRWREKGKANAAGQGQERNLPTGSEGTAGRGVLAAPHSQIDENRIGESNPGRPEIGHSHPATQQEEAIRSSPSPSTFTSPSTSQTSQTSQPSLSGEALYAQARTMPHQPIPNCERDGEYLKLLAKSAELDYPRALAKLGDYAMRRGWTVEAYYWLWRAKRAGMGNLERTLLQVRNAWANGGFRRESANEYEHFSCEQGSVGYALLCIDARHDAADAKAFLSKCAPDFMS